MKKLFDLSVDTGFKFCVLTLAFFSFINGFVRAVVVYPQVAFSCLFLAAILAGGVIIKYWEK